MLTLDSKKNILALCIFTLLFFCSTGFSDDGRSANQIDYASYFSADIRDAEECGLVYQKGEFVFPKQVSNPALTCPDAFSWKLFMTVIQDRFWSHWADETQNWPGKPYGLCVNGGKPGVDCCVPGATNNPENHCPVFPGDQHSKDLKKLTRSNLATASELARDVDLLRIGLPSIVEHANDISIDPDKIRDLRIEKHEIESMPECPASITDNLIPKDYESIGRVIRQTNAELTVRNRPFHDYLFENNLYNATGVMEVFNRNANNLLRSNAPYHMPNQSADANNRKAVLSRIDLPSDAIMIKSNWVHEKLAAQLGIRNDPEHPFISKHMATSLITNPKTDEKCLWHGKHYLMAFHISSKDIPQWVWTTFEHVKLPGRCDITGCNDSFGYKSADKLPPGVADNYVAPHVKNDGLNSSSTVFDRDKIYAAEQVRPELSKLFAATGIGQGSSTSEVEPDPEDKAWQSYRLKGSQVEFTDLEGRRTLLGNSITEAGFMDGSSCITCHSRAGIHVSADGTPNFFKLSVFINSLSDYGYAKSADGIPNKNWFHDSDMPPALDVLQTDFVWGFLFAKEIVKP